MKKILSFLLVVTTMVSCFAQYKIPDYIDVKDFSTIKKYLKDSINKLDPIEGIYDVSLNIKSVNSFDYVPREYNYSYKCAIIRNEKNQFDLLPVSNKEIEEWLPYGMQFSPIGETQIYNVKIIYASSNVSSRVALESLLNFRLSFEEHKGTSIRFDRQEEHVFIKEYPTSSMYETATEETKPNAWSGTGFAIGNGYIVTNSHVASDAKTITIKGIKGDMNTGYSAEIVANDKTNDLAILRINDAQFKGFGAIPYMVGTRMTDVGEDVFVLGYPLTQALGNEIKLTNGIISSRTGYQGDVSTYQISAPVQPGNSGGPMFDSKGNVLGIVVAGVPGAENVGYAIKTSYLKILIESAGLNIRFPANNTISTLSLAEKVKRVKNFVFYIECSK